MLASVMDMEAYSWSADWYRKLVAQASGAAIDSSYRLWFMDNADHTAPPTTYDEALARIGAARDVTEQGAAALVAFTSPSGNIYCALDQSSAYPACELRTGQVEDPSACGDQPMTTQVGRIELRPEGAVPVCNTDTIVQPGAAVLAYGTSAYTRDTACVSEQVGVTCVSRAAPVGFFLAKGTYTLLR